LAQGSGLEILDATESREDLGKYTGDLRVSSRVVGQIRLFTALDLFQILIGRLRNQA
jgi:hypothetical protein